MPCCKTASSDLTGGVGYLTSYWVIVAGLAYMLYYVTIINEVSEDVKNGKCYILFPEGGYDFNNRNHVCDFKAGSFKIALKTKAPIIPVALIDSYRVFNSFWLGPVTTQVHYLKPILFEEYGSLKTQEIAALVRDRINEKINDVLKITEKQEK